MWTWDCVWGLGFGVFEDFGCGLGGLEGSVSG